jgi:D-arabinan exo alpha-(1,3)/(1,5)-arabinofuranosidase (non-reducing end)
MDFRIGYSSLGSLPRIRDCRARRASSYDRSGGNADYVRIAPGETKVFAELPGAGIVRHLWFGGGGGEDH